MSTKPVEILTPAGRMIAGDCFRGNTTDAENRPLVVKQGPNAGQPRTEYYVGIAIPKNDPDWPALWASISEVARRDFPTLFDSSGNCVSPNFAFKVTDGDSQHPNTKGIKPADREGYPGHYVLNFSSGFAPKCYTRGGAAVINNPDDLKRGYYIRISGTVRGNGAIQQPGVFLNLQMIELIGYGPEIVSGKTGTEAFGGVAAALPAGASSTPLAPITPISTGVPAAVAPPLPGGMAPLPGGVPPATVSPPLPGGMAPLPGAPAMAPPLPGGAPDAVAPSLPGGVPPATVAPAPDFLNVAPAPLGAPPATMAPAPAMRKDSAGNAYSEAQLAAAGYTPEQIQALPPA